MDVAAYQVTRRTAQVVLNGLQQVGAAYFLSVHKGIQIAVRWAVGKQYIQAFRNFLPVAFYFSTSLAVVGPVHKPGCNRTAPDFQTFNFSARVFQINAACFFRYGFGQARLSLQAQFMIACDLDFMTLGLALQPLAEPV